MTAFCVAVGLAADFAFSVGTFSNNFWFNLGHLPVLHRFATNAGSWDFLFPVRFWWTCGHQVDTPGEQTSVHVEDETLFLGHFFVGKWRNHAQAWKLEQKHCLNNALVSMWFIVDSKFFFNRASGSQLAGREISPSTCWFSKKTKTFRFIQLRSDIFHMLWGLAHLTRVEHLGAKRCCEASMFSAVFSVKTHPGSTFDLWASILCPDFAILFRPTSLHWKTTGVAHDMEVQNCVQKTPSSTWFFLVLFHHGWIEIISPKKGEAMVDGFTTSLMAHLAVHCRTTFVRLNSHFSWDMAGLCVFVMITSQTTNPKKLFLCCRWIVMDLSSMYQSPRSPKVSRATYLKRRAIGRRTSDGRLLFHIPLGSTALQSRAVRSANHPVEPRLWPNWNSKVTSMSVTSPCSRITKSKWSSLTGHQHHAPVFV